MMQLLKILQVVLTLLPAIIDIIRKLEGVLPEPDQGPAKLDLVKNMIETTYTTASRTTGEKGVGFDQIWPSICLTITVIVKWLNVKGIFASGPIKVEPGTGAEPFGGS
jgi:hypothetical protein